MIRIEAHGPLTFIRMARRLLGRPVYWTGAWLAEGVLVDCGPPATARELLAWLGDRPLRGLVVTHHHEDHMGAAALIRARRAIVPRIHPAGIALLAEGFVQEPYRRLAWGRAPRVAAEPVAAEQRWGSLTLRAIHTPGHSPDHACYFEPERGWLFTGDLFLAERLRFLRSDEDLDALIASLEAVARLPVREVLCAHRGRVQNGPAALVRKAEHLRALREKIADLLRQGLPEKEVARRVVGPEGMLTWLSLGRFSARNFVRAVGRSGRAA